jgi:lysophospholipase L1-like esterase
MLSPTHSIRPRSAAGALLIFLIACRLGQGEDLSNTFFDSPRILFLGDSITYAGGCVAGIECWAIAQERDKTPLIINAGLPSETVSGLSEAGHAGGQFPRPDLHERLERILTVAKPDLVFACYGMNCAIYQPFDAARFEKFRQGVHRLKAAVEKAGAKLILVTPPGYDDQQKPLPFSYNDVLGKYSDWLLSLRDQGTLVIDLHGPMTQALSNQRAADPKFTWQNDGVHPNEAGQWLMARIIIAALGGTDAAQADSIADLLNQHKLPAELEKLVRERMNVQRDAHLTAASHKRPGLPQGLTLPQAEAKADEISAKIRELTR